MSPGVGPVRHAMARATTVLPQYEPAQGITDLCIMSMQHYILLAGAKEATIRLDGPICGWVQVLLTAVRHLHHGHSLPEDLSIAECGARLQLGAQLFELCRHAHLFDITTSTGRRWHDVAGM